MPASVMLDSGVGATGSTHVIKLRQFAPPPRIGAAQVTATSVPHGLQSAAYARRSVRRSVDGPNPQACRIRREMDLVGFPGGR